MDAVLKSKLRGRFGKLCRELEELGLSGQDKQPKRQLSGRGHEATEGFCCCYFDIFAKENNQTKEYSVTCTFNEDTVEGGADLREASSPTHSCHLKKELRYLQRGWARG